MMSDFMNFMAFRQSLIDEKVEECMRQIRKGATTVHFDQGDLTSDEVEQVKCEVMKRIR